jgi:hypothetical protein
VGYKIHKVRLPKPLPLDEFSLIVGDALTNIRAALDHTVWAIATLNGAVPRFRTCSFPFGKNADSFANAVNGCIAVPQEIRARLGTFKAYDGGNTVLWHINEMCNRDKHALLSPVFTGRETADFVAGGSWFRQPETGWREAEDYIELEIVRTELHATCDITFSLDVTFHDPPPMRGQCVVPVLAQFAEAALCVVCALEIETRRLFPGMFT